LAPLEVYVADAGQFLALSVWLEDHSDIAAAPRRWAMTSINFEIVEP
jgi:hypothetical protein